MTIEQTSEEEEDELINIIKENTASRNEIISIVKENSDLLNEVPNEIEDIAHSSFYLDAEKQMAIDSLSITKANKYNTVSCELINFDENKYISKNFKNELLYNILWTKYLYIIQRWYSESGRLCIVFDCSDSIIYYHVGFYYTQDDQPIGRNGEDIDFKQNGEQWIYESDGNQYITERIIDHWFYYEEQQY
jgi:hypothetical protein